MIDVNAIPKTARRGRAIAGGAALSLVALAACAPPAPPMPELSRLRLSMSISTKNLCQLGVSPAIAVANPPEGTARYTVRMTNEDVLFQSVWQETLPAAPTGVAEGAAREYEGPCAGEFQSYRYRFEVIARDAQGRPLAYGQTYAQIWSIGQMAEREREAAAARPAPGQASRTLPAAPVPTAGAAERAPMTLARPPGWNPAFSPTLDPAVTAPYR